jgi:hypothetical protein
VTKLTLQHKSLEFVYEAGPCGYDIYRRTQSCRRPTRSGRSKSRRRP